MQFEEPLNEGMEVSASGSESQYQSSSMEEEESYTSQ